MNADITLVERLGIRAQRMHAKFQMDIVMPILYKISINELDSDFIRELEAPCAEYNLTPAIVLNAILLEKNVFNILEIPTSEYNLRDSFVRKAGRVYTDYELLQTLERRFSQESMDFRITNSAYGEINVVCKNTNAISTITMERVDVLDFYVISTLHYGISALPKLMAHEMNMTTNLIKWDVDQSTCFTLLPNPEYTPTEAADYLIAHNNMIKNYQNKGLF